MKTFFVRNNTLTKVNKKNILSVLNISKQFFSRNLIQIFVISFKEEVKIK